MKNIMVDSYKQHKISSTMTKAFGTIPKNHEEFYAFMLSSMEGNMLKLHRQNAERSGRHANDAIQMALLTIDGYLRQIEYDFSRFVTPENQVLLQGLLMSFDPYTNQEIGELVKINDHGFDTKEYFGDPIKCLLRIQKSIQLWNEEWGKNGYFIFIERELGQLVEWDEKMNFSIPFK
ncbi:MAG: hypothetical protein WD469_00820 [Paenibacillaceae bacterium]